ncbi:hypothetical protein D3C84_446220 [compost metagenome]
MLGEEAVEALDQLRVPQAGEIEGAAGVRQVRVEHQGAGARADVVEVVGGDHDVVVGAVGLLFHRLLDHLAQVGAAHHRGLAGADALLVGPGRPAIHHRQPGQLVDALALALWRHQHAVDVLHHRLAVDDALAALQVTGPVGAVRVLEVDAAIEQVLSELVDRQRQVLDIQPGVTGEQVEQVAGEALVLALVADPVVGLEGLLLDANHIGLRRGAVST